VFLSLTGHAAEHAGEAGEDGDEASRDGHGGDRAPEPERAA
jgi:hypothetical protein